MRALLWPVLSMVAAGCWQPRYFAPRENVNGESPTGEAAAVYPIDREGDERVAGEVRLWSRGAKARFTDEDEEVVDLHVGFELENNGQVPLELDLDSVAVEELFVDGYLQDPLPPTTVRGSGRAAPGTTERVDLVFRPPTTYPRDIDSFAVRFAIRDGLGAPVGQVTPFAPARARSYYAVGVYGAYPYWGWGGYYYGPWGWGTGFWGGYWCR